MLLLKLVLPFLYCILLSNWDEMKNLLEKWSLQKLMFVVISFGAVGLVLLALSYAANQNISIDTSQIEAPSSNVITDGTAHGGSFLQFGTVVNGPNDCINIQLLSHDEANNTANYRVTSENSDISKYDIKVGDVNSVIQPNGTNSKDIEINYFTNQLETTLNLSILVDITSSNSNAINRICQTTLSISKHPSLSGLHFIKSKDLILQLEQATTPNQQKAVIDTAIDRMKALGAQYGQTVSGSTVTFEPLNNLQQSLVRELGASLVNNPDSSAQTGRIYDAMNSLLIAVSQTPVELYSKIGLDYWFIVFSFRDSGLDAEADDSGTIALNGTSTFLQSGIVHHEIEHILDANQSLTRGSNNISNTWRSLNPPGFRYIDSNNNSTVTLDEEGFYIGFPSDYATVELQEDVAEFYQALFKHDADDFLAEKSKADFTVHLAKDQILREKYEYLQRVISDVLGISTINGTTFEAIRNIDIGQ